MSNRLVALYQNYADAAVLYGGSWLSSLPLTNLKDPDPGRVARSTNPLVSSTIFVVDLGAVRTIGGVALCNTNLSPGATFRIRAWSNAALSVLVHDSGMISVPGSRIDWSDTGNWLAWEDPGFWYGIPDVFAEDELPTNLVKVFATDLTARYWTVEIFDTGNADGYVEIGRLLTARAFRPSINYSYGDNQFQVEWIYDAQESLGGKETIWDRARRRTLRVAWQNLPESELFSSMFRLNMLGPAKQIFIVPDPDDTTNFQKRSFLATLRSPPPIVQVVFEHGTTVIDCKEVV